VPSVAGRIRYHSVVILHEVIFVQVDKSESQAVQYEKGPERCVGFVVKDTKGAVYGDRVLLAGLKVLVLEEGCEILIGNLADRYSGSVDA
jgi:hypothetical protein